MENKIIVSTNPNPLMQDFEDLIKRTSDFLNLDAQKNASYYIDKNAQKLESVVFEILKEKSIGTKFENSIELVSGKNFPDIVANKFYGIEVKSTTNDHYTTIGGSILESTRIESVERIFLAFGKLKKPIEFIFRPYEECLSDISVTHYPRYKIDMKLGHGETIFDKMNTSYNNLRQSSNIMDRVTKYYRSLLKEGESLWWIGRDYEKDMSVIVRLWSSLEKREKDKMIAYGCALFPEIAGSNYSRFALWLVTQKGIVNTNIRDGFSAGGKIKFTSECDKEIIVPAFFGRILNFKDTIKEIILGEDKKILEEFWKINVSENRVRQWLNLVIEKGKLNAKQAEYIKSIF